MVDDLLCGLAVVLDVAAIELLDARSRAGNLSREDDLGPQRARVHDTVDRRVTGLPEVPAALQCVRETVRDDLGVQVGLVDLLNVDLRVVHIEAVLKLGGDLTDVLPALPDHHAGLFGLQDDLRAHRRLGDIHAAVAGATEFVCEELVDL